jgi:hypothetical protein
MTKESFVSEQSSCPPGISVEFDNITYSVSSRIKSCGKCIIYATSWQIVVLLTRKSRIFLEKPVVRSYATRRFVTKFLVYIHRETNLVYTLTHLRAILTLPPLYSRSFPVRFYILNLILMDPCIVVWFSSEFRLRLDYGRIPHAYVNQRLQIQLELLMMSGLPLETCWAFNERWNNKFCYKVESCWLFLLNQIYYDGPIQRISLRLGFNCVQFLFV